tara:strand:- start:1989 stop:3311 length:1323 start_codon:yes stop_codon:yes gene_type:complete
MFRLFTRYLFYKIGLLVVLFSIFLTAVIFYTVDYYYTDPDTLLDAHELYFYSNIVENWHFPKDSTEIKNQIDNLHWIVAFYNPDSTLKWSYPQPINPAGYLNYLDSDDMETLHNVTTPMYVSLGSTDEIDYVTYVKTDSMHVFIALDQQVASEYINYLPPIFVSILFMIIFYMFIRYFFQPIGLINKRIHLLRDGDLKSQIKIIGNDELADLSKSINQMIEDIKALLSQKQRLLLDVSHELRSPLARMRLLIEMIPDHKNKNKLIDEIVFLEGMISNFLLSDKLSLPYSNIEQSSFTMNNLLNTVIDLINVNLENFDIKNETAGLIITGDKTKLIIALRNLIDNALKYGDKNEKIKISTYTNNGNYIIKVANRGHNLSSEEMKEIFKPFYRSSRIKNNTSGFGLGLTIAQKVVEGHGGRLIASINDHYVEFSIEIPIDKK